MSIDFRKSVHVPDLKPHFDALLALLHLTPLVFQQRPPYFLSENKTTPFHKYERKTGKGMNENSGNYAFLQSRFQNAQKTSFFAIKVSKYGYLHIFVLLYFAPSSLSNCNISSSISEGTKRTPSPNLYSFLSIKPFFWL